MEEIYVFILNIIYVDRVMIKVEDNCQIKYVYSVNFGGMQFVQKLINSVYVDELVYYKLFNFILQVFFYI